MKSTPTYKLLLLGVGGAAIALAAFMLFKPRHTSQFEVNPLEVSRESADDPHLTDQATDSSAARRLENAGNQRGNSESSTIFRQMIEVAELHSKATPEDLPDTAQPVETEQDNSDNS